MLTVESLTSELGLKIAAGGDGAAEREIRWVHITELLDPTPWLQGGELLLTTGIRLDAAQKQRGFIRLLAESGVAGLGFGTGFDHAKIPKAVISEAEAAGFPIFEVPYEMPFIAITEAAFSRLVNEQYDVLSRGIAVN
jgi:purine catabolism regulator